MRTRQNLGDLPEGSNENNHVPPPLQNMVDVLMQIEQNLQAQTALLEALMHNMAPHEGGGTGCRDDFSDFLMTQPLTFMWAEDPLDTNHWL